ncbi:OmpP1/FadL family transporter [Shinella zoogloeoides]|jgi:long-chain fatty acid transport protein|uniref:Transporter n=1 Tax=Shinella zoogloeoides TaxID=352475 RepID=A0A6N8TDL2_SHIZO|nr:OmpP1/FadL family transporter [Shinella zoogloeoides]MXN99189.1 transporter [Shinella zoogloeoides]UEX83026.1 OmpP1/FadL family transporter [Shinella zoogloeoides]
MRKNKLGLGAMAAVSLLAATSAHAGGLERGGYNIDLLFDPSDYAAEAAVTYVNPQRKLNNVRDSNTGTPGVTPGGDGNVNSRPSSGIGATEGYWVPRIGFKASIGDAVNCMADYSEPWGAHLNQGANWAGANENIETKIDVENYATTCSYSFDVGPGKLRVIGGGFYQEVSGFQERLAAYLGAPVSSQIGVGRLDMEGSGWGWRAGIAYEIEEYALRTSLVYNSAVDLDNLSGTLNLSQLPAMPGTPFGKILPVYGNVSLPDALEFKFQTGIAPDWLAFGSVKWTDWSQLQSIPFCAKGTGPCTPGLPTGGTNKELTSIDLLYRDGWTVSGGVGHKFNDKWSGALSLTWDRGVSTGVGTHTDTWTVGAGVSYAATENVEFRIAGALGVLTSGSSGATVRDGRTYGQRASYDFGDDLVSAISTSLKVKF